MAFILLYWKQIAIALLVAAAVAALSYAYNSHVDRLIDEAVTKAVTTTNANWEKAEQVAIAKAHAEAAAKEAEQAKAFASLQTDYQKEKDRADQADSARLAAIHNGSRLRIPSGCSSSPNVPNPPTSSAGSNGPPAAQFLGEADSAFLVGEAKRADEIVRQLNLCQATLTSERK